MVEIIEMEESSSHTKNHVVVPVDPPEVLTQGPKQRALSLRPVRPRRYQKRVQGEKHVDNTYNTKDWLETLDDYNKFALSTGTMALIGATLTSTQQRSLDGRDSCDTGPEVVRSILVTGGWGFALLTASSGIAMISKMVGRKFKSPKSKKLKTRSFRVGLISSALITSVGTICLAICLSDLFEVRLGLRDCGADWSLAMTILFESWGGLMFLFLFGAALFAFFSC